MNGWSDTVTSLATLLKICSHNSELISALSISTQQQLMVNIIFLSGKVIQKLADNYLLCIWKGKCKLSRAVENTRVLIKWVIKFDMKTTCSGRWPLVGFINVYTIHKYIWCKKSIHTLSVSSVIELDFYPVLNKL